MFRRKKKNESGIKKPAIGRTVDFSILKDFINYGIGRTTSNIKIKRYTDIKTREDLSKKKPETDWIKIGTFFIFLMVGILIVFLILTQYMDYSAMATQNANLMGEVATLKGQLAACQAQSGGVVVPVLHG